MWVRCFTRLTVQTLPVLLHVKSCRSPYPTFITTQQIVLCLCAKCLIGSPLQWSSTSDYKAGRYTSKFMLPCSPRIISSSMPLSDTDDCWFWTRHVSHMFQLLDKLHTEEGDFSRRLNENWCIFGIFEGKKGLCPCYNTRSPIFVFFERHK